MITSILILALGLSITDGDTFAFRGDKVRIANIDAPEVRSAKCDAERRLGLAAKQRLAELLQGRNIVVHPGDPKDGRLRDRHGRLLATVSVDGKDVGETLIAEGLARPWEGRRKPWCGAAAR